MKIKTERVQITCYFWIGQSDEYLGSIKGTTEVQDFFKAKKSIWLERQRLWESLMLLGLIVIDGIQREKKSTKPNNNRRWEYDDSHIRLTS